MYGDQRVLTCDECGVSGEDVDPVVDDGERRTLCPTHNQQLLSRDGSAPSPPDRSEIELEPEPLTEIADDRVDDLLDLFRLQTLKRGRDSWDFELEDVARDLRVDEEDARTLIKAARNRQTPFGVYSGADGQFSVRVGGEASA